MGSTSWVVCNPQLKYIPLCLLLMWLVGESNHHLIRYEITVGITQLIKMVLILLVLCYQEPEKTQVAHKRKYE